MHCKHTHTHARTHARTHTHTHTHTDNQSTILQQVNMSTPNNLVHSDSKLATKEAIHGFK